MLYQYRREHLAGAQPVGLEAALSVALHVVGEHRVEEHGTWPNRSWKMSGSTMVELFGRANPVGYRELAVRQQGEEGHFGDQPRDGHDFPAGAVQAFVDVFKTRDLFACAQRGQGRDKASPCLAAALWRSYRRR